MDDWYVTHWTSPLGPMTLACGDDGLKGLWFDGQVRFGAGLTGAERTGESALTRRAVAWLEGFFAGNEPLDQGLPLAPEGTPFQRTVWRLLMEIPRGKIVTYGELALRLSETSGRCASARAVGSAVGRNPIAIMIPCHRVVGANGKLTGYAGGIERKAALLRLEGADVASEAHRGRRCDAGRCFRENGL